MKMDANRNDQKLIQDYQVELSLKVIQYSQHAHIQGHITLQIGAKPHEKCTGAIHAR